MKISESMLLVDSGCDLEEAFLKEIGAELVPLTIRIEDEIYADDFSLDTKKLIGLMKISQSAPTTSCPSPEEYRKVYSTDRDNFVVTLSSKLSGSYNSAVLAANMFREDGSKSVNVFDSKSACSGEVLVALKIVELLEKGKSSEDIVSTVGEYISSMRTFFVIDSLDNLIKAGRISSIKGKLANMLSIVPIMKADDGEIVLAQKVRGKKNAFRKMVEMIGEGEIDLEERVMAISHCNALDKAKSLKEEIMKKYSFRDVVILETRGIGTVYAGEGAIILSF